MSTHTPTPALPTRGASVILTHCAAFAISVFFAGGLWMIMR